jgi:hypothetical protein
MSRCVAGHVVAPMGLENLTLPVAPRTNAAPTEEPPVTPTVTPAKPDIEVEPNTVPHTEPIREPEGEPCERPGTSCPLH